MSLLSEVVEQMGGTLTELRTLMGAKDDTELVETVRDLKFRYKKKLKYEQAENKALNKTNVILGESNEKLQDRSAELAEKVSVLKQTRDELLEAIRQYEENDWKKNTYVRELTQKAEAQKEKEK